MKEMGHNYDWKKGDTIMNERNGTQLWLEEEEHNNEWKKWDTIMTGRRGTQ